MVEGLAEEDLRKMAHHLQEKTPEMGLRDVDSLSIEDLKDLSILLARVNRRLYVKMLEVLSENALLNMLEALSVEDRESVYLVAAKTMAAMAEHKKKMEKIAEFDQRKLEEWLSERGLEDCFPALVKDGTRSIDLVLTLLDEDLDVIEGLSAEQRSRLRDAIR
jgi:hypothetical protein